MSGEPSPESRLRAAFDRARFAGPSPSEGAAALVEFDSALRELSERELFLQHEISAHRREHRRTGEELSEEIATLRAAALRVVEELEALPSNPHYRLAKAGDDLAKLVKP